jgi:hypothetical protein
VLAVVTDDYAACMVLGLSVTRGSEAGTASWAGGCHQPGAVYFAGVLEVTACGAVLSIPTA